jgi:CO dehydrogenase/acetyl-CoA synthase epsilon subunit
MSCEPWQCAEGSATKKAMAITKPEVAASLIKRASRPILVVGSNANIYNLEGKLLIEYLIDFAKASKVPIVATRFSIVCCSPILYGGSNFIWAYAFRSQIANCYS